MEKETQVLPKVISGWSTTQLLKDQGIQLREQNAKFKKWQKIRQQNIHLKTTKAELLLYYIFFQKTNETA